MFKKVAALLCGVLVVTGVAVIPSGLRPSVYLSYSLLALAAFGLELADGVSMGFVFVILALPQMNWVEALFLAESALFILAIALPPRPTPEALLRRLGVTGAAVVLSQAAYHAHFLSGLDAVFRSIIAAVICFIPYNTGRWRNWNWWSFPYYPVTAVIGSVFPISIALAPLMMLTWRSCRFYGGRLEEQCAASRSAAALHLRTLETLALAIEARDQPLTWRSRRVQIYSVEIAREMGLPPEEVEALRAASLLYDIGELAIPEHIMLKSGRLTQEEFEKVKTHTAVGAAILESARFPFPVVPIVRAHHERWDGAGYPCGLDGKQIPAGARILAAVDAVDALASPRQHRAAYSLKEAVRRVAADAGAAFDPRVTALIAKHYREWEKRVAEQTDGSFTNSIFTAQREAKALFELNRTLGTSLEPGDMFKAIREAILQLIAFETVVLWVERDGFLFPAHLAGNHLALFSSLHIPMGGGVSGRAAAHEEIIANGDPSVEMAHLGGARQQCPFRDVLSAPVQAGPVRGALSLYRTGGRSFSSDDGRVLLFIASKFGVPLANGYKFQQLNDEALSDPLTGLPNAKALAARLTQMTTFATVVVCDLDGFKQVNDRFGHLTGNRVLEALAEGFRKSCREGDFVARMGGDEFVVLLPQLPPDDINSRMAQFRAMVRATGTTVCGAPVLDASFGAASHPRDGSTPDELLACADRRMYRRKAGQESE